MLKKEPDKLELLKAHYREQIKSTEDNLKALRAQLAIIEQVEAEAEKRMAAKSATSVGATNYSTLGLTAAVTDALGKIAGEHGVPAPEIRRYLLAHGFMPQGNNFGVSVGTTLKRLVASKKAVALGEGKGKTYRLRTVTYVQA